MVITVVQKVKALGVTDEVNVVQPKAMQADLDLFALQEHGQLGVACTQRWLPLLHTHTEIMEIR